MTPEGAIKQLKEYILGMNYMDDEAVWMAIKALEQQPRGRWIDDKCSVCGKGIEDLISSREWYRNEEPNFCPFCGVEMSGGGEGESNMRNK